MKIIYLVTLLFLSHAAFCQFYYPTQEKANLVLEKTLVIELLEDEDENNKILNEILIQVFKDKWTQTPVEFMSSSNIQKKIEAKDENYFYLFQRVAVKEEVKSRTSAYLDKNGRRTMNSVGSPHKVEGDYVAFSFEYYPFDLKIIKNGGLKSITSICFANSELSKLDYVFLFQQLDLI